MSNIWSGVSPLAATFVVRQGVVVPFTVTESRVDVIGAGILRVQIRVVFTGAGTPATVVQLFPTIPGITFSGDNANIPLGRYNFNDASTALKQVGNALWDGFSMCLNFQANNTALGTALGTDPAITIAVGDSLTCLFEILTA